MLRPWLRRKTTRRFLGNWNLHTNPASRTVGRIRKSFFLSFFVFVSLFSLGSWRFKQPQWKSDEVEIWPYPPPIVVSVDFHPQHQETQKTNVSGNGAISGAGENGGKCGSKTFRTEEGQQVSRNFQCLKMLPVFHMIMMDKPINNPIINY